MTPETRDRLVLPVLIPVASMAAIGLVVYALSRILLAVPKESATPIAIAAALNLLVGCALVASLPRLRSSTLVAVMVVLGLGVAGGGVAALTVTDDLVYSSAEARGAAEQEAGEAPGPKGPPPPPGGGKESPPAAGGGGGAAEVTAPAGAAVTGFETTELSLPAGSEVTLTFDNQDPGIQHNVGIYTEQGGDELFMGDIIPGPDTTEYMVPALDAGTYHFQCDVHPTTMTGTLTVA